MHHIEKIITQDRGQIDDIKMKLKNNNTKAHHRARGMRIMDLDQYLEKMNTITKII